MVDIDEVDIVVHTLAVMAATATMLVMATVVVMAAVTEVHTAVDTVDMATAVDIIRNNLAKSNKLLLRDSLLYLL